MKRKFSIALCVLGVACILIGLYQVISSSYQFNKEQYKECMELYESCKLDMQTSMFYDIRQNYADIASDMYDLALDYQSEIEQSNLICIVLCVLGILLEVVAIFLRKHSNEEKRRAITD